MYIKDTDLGQIKLKENARSKSIIVRFRDGEFVLTHPPYVSRTEILKAVDQMRPKLLILQSRSAKNMLFAEDTNFETLTFKLKIISSSLSNIYSQLKDGELIISYPNHLDLNGKEMQSYIKKVLEGACRSEAKRIFADMTYKLANEYGFEVGQIKINNSRTRWGSCSSTKNINLSFFLMTLPMHLAEFVIMHELCHTIEMNHGERFWALLNKVSGGKAKELTRELKERKLTW